MSIGKTVLIAAFLSFCGAVFVSRVVDPVTMARPGLLPALPEARAATR